MKTKSADSFVVHTQPNSEQRVYERLKRQHYTLYFPRVKVRRAHAGRVDWAHRAFLQRYMFVEDDGRGVSDIKRTEGVCDVVRAGLIPVRLRAAEIDRIRAREVDGFVMLDLPLPKMFRPGEMLRVTSGPLVDRDVIFSRMSGETRAIIFLNAVIGRVESELPITTLERIRVEQSAA